MDEDRGMDVERHLREMARSVEGHDWSLSADDVRKAASRARISRLRWGMTLGAVAAATLVVVAVVVPAAGRQRQPQVTTTTPPPHHQPAPVCYPAPAGDQAVAYVVTLDAAGTVARPYSATVTAVDLPTGRIRWKVALPAGIGVPVAIQVAGGQGWILGGQPDRSSVLTSVNLATGAVGSLIPVGASSSNISGLALSPDGNTAYVAQSGQWSANIGDTGTTVVPVNLVTRRAETPIQIGRTPLGVAITPDGQRIYVTVESAVRLIDVSARRAVATIPLHNPLSLPVGIVAGPIAAAPSGRLVLLGNQIVDMEIPGHVLDVIDTTTNQPETPIQLPGYMTGGPIAFSCDSSSAYVSTSAGLTRVNLDSRASGVIGRTGQYGFLPHADFVVVPGGRGLWMIGTPYCVNGCSPQGYTELVPVGASSPTAGKPILGLSGTPAGIVIAYEPAGH